MGSPTDSIPPDEARTILGMLRALVAHIQGLGQILLQQTHQQAATERAVRELIAANLELIGAVKADRESRDKATTAATVTHPVVSSVADVLKGIAANQRAILFIGFAMAVLIFCLALLTVSSVAATPDSVVYQFLLILDRHLPGGTP